MTQASEELLALVDKCEAAAEPEWIVDHEIALALGWEQMAMDWQMKRDWRGPDGRIQREPPRYTASLDAATTLVPEGWVVNRLGQTTRGWTAVLTRGLAPGPTSADRAYSGDVATAALVLCAAALRALANKATPHG